MYLCIFIYINIIIKPVHIWMYFVSYLMEY